MSIECGECEADLRGGHAAGCSRYVHHEPSCALRDDEEATCTCRHRRLIVFDGERWHVRSVFGITHHQEHGRKDEKHYLCDEPLVNDLATLAEVPEVAALLTQAVNDTVDVTNALRKQYELPLREPLEQLGHDVLDMIEHHNELHERQGSMPCRSVEKVRIGRNLKLLRAAVRRGEAPCEHPSTTRYVGCGGRYFDICDECEAIVERGKEEVAGA